MRENINGALAIPKVSRFKTHFPFCVTQKQSYPARFWLLLAFGDPHFGHRTRLYRTIKKEKQVNQKDRLTFTGMSEVREPIC